jgi:hypothetical protein
VRVKKRDIAISYHPPPLNPLPPGEGKLDFLRDINYVTFTSGSYRKSAPFYRPARGYKRCPAER